MAKIIEKISAEQENIKTVLLELEKVKDRPDKELVVIVGMGAYLQNIYSGMENILKQLLQYKNISLSNTPTWHKDLLDTAVEQNILSQSLAEEIGKYLFFRHFFIHAYGFQIDLVKLKPLIDNVSIVCSKFEKEINRYIETNVD